MLLPIIPISIAGAVSTKGLGRIRMVIPAALMVFGLLVTMSKGAIAGLFVGLVSAAPLLRKSGVKLKHVGFFAVAVACFVVVIPRDLILSNYDLFLYRIDNPEIGRPELWTVAWRAFLSHPLLGIGPNVIYIYNHKFGADVLYTHNFVLENLAQLGVAGAIPFFLIIGTFLRRSYRSCLSAMSDPGSKHIAIGLFIGLVSTLAHGLVEPTFPGQQYAVLFWITMSLLTVLSQGLRERSLIGDPARAIVTASHNPERSIS